MDKDDPVNGNTTHPPLRPVRGTARVAVVALALAAVAWAARAVWHIRLSVAGMPAAGPMDQGGGQHRPPTALEDGYHIVSSVGDAVTVLCAAMFLNWLWRVRDNARAFSGERPRYIWPWMYLGWIVPIMNLWVPRGIVVDIHRASAPGERLPGVVNWWWGLWLAGMLGGAGLIYADDTDDVIVRAYTDVGLLLAADAAVIGAAVACALVVRTLTTVQQDRLDRTARDESAGASESADVAARG
ncbi:DUF4328 domain-containing protein [Streptomyces sp. KM273126]|uniref:DUF4328 domain-containing protein n=1 Tax=Streptomyces sp. KM273126 TaxID=2545247 RepID=UPI00103CA9F3|nr:DUF4328 domain-containing protein [Streptomyces sp. KM273126]MBA2807686.1 DUF4328 domain-containing protein [Streptomyces sp. KM273126]